MIDFIENIGDYFSQHYFTDDFPKKVFDKSGFVSQGKSESGEKVENHISTFNKSVGSLREKYYKFKNDYLTLKRTKDKTKLAHDFNTEILKVLGYQNGTQSYDHPVFLEDNKVIPVRYRFNKGDKPYLFVMEMMPMIKIGDTTPDGLYEQNYTYEDWESVLPESFQEYEIKPEVIKEALSELFLLPEDERPEYLIMMAGSKIFLIQYEKWKYDSYLIFDLEELFVLTQVPANKNFLALFYALLAKKQFISESESVLSSLEEDAHKASYGVTKTLKSAVIYAVENLANEALVYRQSQLNTIDDKRKIIELIEKDKFAQELKDDCLTFVYRLLFLFYAESREDLEILPVNDPTYQKGYSMEMLRDLEMVQLTTDSSRNGYFFSDSLWKLFEFLHEGRQEQHGFILKPLDSPLFDNGALKHLSGTKFRNSVLQEIVLRLSLSERTRNKSRGRISYSNLGINQLGSVYESLLAYSGFFAKEDLIEVKAAKDKTGKDGTFLVPKSRRDDFKEDEVLKDPEHPSEDVTVKRGQFVYRLNGRDRKKSASYYTPEVLTQCTVKYTLKGILDKLREKQNVVDGELTGEYCADEILKLKILEPAMGAAAFHNEVINQLSVAYLELKEQEEVHRGRKRIVPGNYKDEQQKVKAFIAANNVYGVDLNPTAVELGKLSLWLNCMHKNMETPFFGHRLGTGNAVVGAWLKVYSKSDVIEEFPTEGTANQRKKPIPKEWWDKAPNRVKWKGSNLTRKDEQIYHFLLPDANMVPSYGIKLLKEELTDVEKKAFTDWRNDFKAPITSSEHKRLAKISRVIDHLLDEHYRQTLGVIEQTTSIYQIYGQEQLKFSLKAYDEKEMLSNSRNSRTAPYFKLKMIMDYWCSLWFWDVRDVKNLPSRTQWYNEIESLLNIDTSTLPENASEQNIKTELRKKSSDLTLIATFDRIDTVEELTATHRFFHTELEFIEVFKERNGFDVIVGNPPWVGIEYDVSSLVAEEYPEVAIRRLTAPEVKKKVDDIRVFDKNINVQLIIEELWATNLKQFLACKQLYNLLEGQRNNLYKAVLIQSFGLISQKGYAGLVHPLSILEDPRAKNLRKEAYSRLKYLFEFKNALFLFKDVHDQQNYSVNIYSGISTSPNFEVICNLFHPNTIDGCFQSTAETTPGGIKIFDHKTESYIWNVLPHKDRKITISNIELSILGQTFDEEADSTKFVSIHALQLLKVLKKISAFGRSIDKIEYYQTDCWNETTTVKDGSLIKGNIVPEYNSYDMVFSGPHFHVANPYYKSPRKSYKNSSDYDVINLDKTEDKYLPRSLYRPKNESTIRNRFDKGLSKLWLNGYKIAFSEMLNIASERTLQPSIIPPRMTHLGTVRSVFLKDPNQLLELASLCSSILFDFITKLVGRGHLKPSDLKRFKIGVNSRVLPLMKLRTLMLNCLTEQYSDLWSESWMDSFRQDKWSKEDSRLTNLDSLNSSWNREFASRNSFERRLALVELDVLSAIALEMTLEELILVFNVQFPVLQQNDENTWYDKEGEIVFTRSAGLTGVGVESADWNLIKDYKEGQMYEYVITKSELYKGETINYHAPFHKCDRVEDYKTAWAHFEKVLNQVQVETV